MGASSVPGGRYAAPPGRESPKDLVQAQFNEQTALEDSADAARVAVDESCADAGFDPRGGFSSSVVSGAGRRSPG
eukprot:5053731-Lingulodinium_polyedra.AAC.1